MNANRLDDNAEQATHHWYRTKAIDTVALKSPLPHLGLGGETAADWLQNLPALPNPETLEETYWCSIALIGRHFPLQATNLQDRLRRVKEAICQWRALREELEAEVQRYNQDVYAANVQIEIRIGELEAKYEDQRQALMTQVREIRENLVVVRAEWARHRIRTGSALPVANWQEVDDETFDVIPTAMEGEILTTRQIGASVSAELAVPIPRKGWRTLLADAGKPLASMVQSIKSVASALTVNRSRRDSDVPVVVETHAEQADYTADPDVLCPPVFSLEEALEQAPSYATLASQERLTCTETPSSMISRGLHGIGFMLARIVAGAMLGTSVGVIVGLLDPRLISLRPDRYYAPLAALFVIGTVLFWLMERIASGYVEEWAHSLFAPIMAQHREKREEMLKFYARAGRITMVIMSAFVLLILGIEIVVERNGVVQLFLDKMLNQNIVANTNHTQDVSWTYWLLAAVAAVPFICFHLLEGWRQGRRNAIEGYLSGLREECVYDIAQKLFSERKAEFRERLAERTLAQNTTIESAHHERLAVSADSDSIPASFLPESPLSRSVSDESVSQDEGEEPATPLSGEERELDSALHIGGTYSTQIERNSQVTPLYEPTIEDWEACAEVHEKVRHQVILLRETMKQEREVVAEGEDRKAEWQSRLHEETLDLPADSKLRLRDAYLECVAADRDFCTTFAGIQKDFERYMRGGLWSRIRAWLFRAPISPDSENDRADRSDKT